jgi:hypothetical protein
MSSKPPEKLYALKHAAEALALPYHRVQRAARAGLIPTYKLGGSRTLVRLSEIVAVIERTKKGGA